jgi:GDP-4-dehydro-6-deoxy-D-mannose reductase
MGKKILVTGAGGFIGTALSRCLAPKRAITVLGIGRRMLPAAGPHYHRVDLLNKKHLKIFLKQERPDIIFHLAGGRSGELPQLIDGNVLTTINLLETIRSLGKYRPRVMITGSAAEYGEISGPRRPILENASNHPAGLYGRVKLLQTQTALHYAGLGQDIVIARLFNILGPGIGEDMMPGKIARDIIALERSSQSGVLRVSRLDVVRDFLDIRDICEALYILSSKGEQGEIYNICSQKGVTMRTLLSGMIAASGLPGIKVKENKRIKPGVMYAIGSSVKLRRTTGWQARYNLSQSILDTLAFYRQKQGPV